MELSVFGVVGSAVREFADFGCGCVLVPVVRYL